MEAERRSKRAVKAWSRFRGPRRPHKDNRSHELPRLAEGLVVIALGDEGDGRDLMLLLP